MRSSRYSSYRTMSAYESSQAWRARYKGMREKFEAGQADATNSLTSAMIDNATGSGDLAARIASARIAAEKKAKAEAAAKLPETGIIDPSRADVKESIFSEDGSGKLDSGTSIDLSGGTMTLSNGTKIDLATGTKVFDFTV